MNWIDNLQYALVQALIDASWSSAVLALSAYGLLKLLHKHSAALRHNLALLLLSAMLLLPAWRFVQTLNFGLSNPGNVSFSSVTQNSYGILNSLPLTPLSNFSEALVYLSWFWLLGVVTMLLRLVGAYCLLDRWQTVTEIHLLPDWRGQFQQLCQRMAMPRLVQLKILRQTLEPYSAFVLKPIVAMPLELFQHLSQHHLIAILAHELAHIKRYDWLWNSWQCLIEALLFFHPGVWWLSRQIRIEREHACDDLALQQAGLDPICLAEALAQLAQLQQAQSSYSTPGLLASYANGAYPQGGILFKRIHRLILPNSDRRAAWSAILPTTLLLFSLVLMPVLLRPGLALAQVSTVMPAAIFATSQTDELFDSAATLPPLPPVPELPAEIPPPPAPPAPPEPPAGSSLEKLEIFKEIQTRLTHDARVTQMLGSPLQIAQHGEGRIYIKEFWFELGQSEARLSLPVTGPLGTATLHLHALRPDHTWQFKRLSLQTKDSRQVINLLPGAN